MIHRLLRDSAAYTLSALLTRGLSLLLLPVYVRLLTQPEYGAYDLLVVIGSLAAVTVSLEITQSVMRFVTMPDLDVPAARVVSTGLWWVVGSYLSLLVVAGALHAPLASALRGDVAGSTVIVLAAVQFGAAAMVNFWTVVYRARLDTRSAVALPVVSALLAGGLSVALLLRSGNIGGLFVGQALGQGLCAAFVLLRERQVVRRFPDRALLKRMLGFSAPLVLSSVAFVSMTYLDRFMVRAFLGLSDLADYALAGRLAMGLSILLLGFQSALSPLVYSEVRSPDLPAQLARLFRRFLLVTAGVVLAALLFGEVLIRWLAGAEYTEGAPVFALLCAALLIQGGYVFFPGLFLAGRTRLLAGINLGCLALNAVLNPVLIHEWGLVGSAVATLVSAVVNLVLMARLSQPFFRVPLTRSTPSSSGTA